MHSSSKKKKTFVQNSFETALEKSAEATKTVATEVAGAFIPLFDEIFPKAETQKAREQGKNDFSEVDYQKLQAAYARKDEEEIARLQMEMNPELKKEQEEKKLQHQYHRRVQQEEERYNAEEEQKKQEEERQKAYEEQERKKQEEEERSKQQIAAPKGKVRKSILGGRKRKANMEIGPEMNPNKSKN